jgi:hypothetical protein
MGTLAKFKIVLIISVLLLASCTITPNHVISQSSSYDSTVPAQYESKNSGVLFLVRDSHGKVSGAVVTQDCKKYYDSLCDDYGDQVTAAGIKAGDGCTIYIDEYKNKLWFIDSQHIVYFQLMSVWKQDNKPKTSILKKVLQ